MGTNFYVEQTGCENDCGHCNERTRIHLGKSSAGWRFLFKVSAIPTDAVRPGVFHNPIEIWLKTAKSGNIIDEYEKPWPLADLLSHIMMRQSGQSNAEYPDPQYYTWNGFDFCTGEFS